MYSQEKNQVQPILNELAIQLVNNKRDFVDLLNETGIPASMDDSERVLLDKFFDASDDSELILGASMLSVDTSSSFDSDDDLNDQIAYRYAVLKDFFDCENENGCYEYDEPYSNTFGDGLKNAFSKIGSGGGGEEQSSGGGGGTPTGPVAAIAKAVGSISDTARVGMINKARKEGRGMDMLQQKQDARNQTLQSVLDLKKTKLQTKANKTGKKVDKTKILLYSLGGLVVIGLTVLIAVKIAKK